MWTLDCGLESGLPSALLSSPYRVLGCGLCKTIARKRPLLRRVWRLDYYVGLHFGLMLTYLMLPRHGLLAGYMSMCASARTWRRSTHDIATS